MGLPQDAQKVTFDILIPALEGDLNIPKEAVQALKNLIKETNTTKEVASSYQPLQNGNLRTCVFSLFTLLTSRHKNSFGMFEEGKVFNTGNRDQVNLFAPFLVYDGTEVNMVFTVRDLLTRSDDTPVTMVFPGKEFETHYFYFTVGQVRDYYDKGYLPPREKFKRVFI